VFVEFVDSSGTYIVEFQWNWCTKPEHDQCIEGTFHNRLWTSSILGAQGCLVLSGLRSYRTFFLVIGWHSSETVDSTMTAN
jgi:hypothetical protein